MNYMIFQRKNNKLIHIQKDICAILIMKQSPLVPRGSTLLQIGFDSFISNICFHFHFLYFRIPKIVLSMWGPWNVKQI